MSPYFCDFTKYQAQGPLASYKQQPCLFTCSTSLPALYRAVSICYSHSRDQPNRAALPPTKVSFSTKENEPKRLLLSTKTNDRFVFETVLDL